MSLIYKCYVCDKRKINIGQISKVEIRGTVEGVPYKMEREVCKKCWGLFNHHPDGEYEYRGE